jgi:hypothetical protein
MGMWSSHFALQPLPASDIPVSSEDLGTKNSGGAFMRYGGLLGLQVFRDEVDHALLNPDRRHAVALPSNAVHPWNGAALARANENLLSAFSRQANLYALFTGTPGGNAHQLRYIGKTTRRLARQRLRNHLFLKHEDTGSKLAQVAEHCCSGTGSVQVAWVSVEPESLRNYLEEELIAAHPEADWNRENRAASA